MSELDSASPKRLRIAVLNRQFAATGGGAERYSIALVEQLAASHNIHVFAQHIDHSWPGISYHRIACPMERPRWINQLWFATASWLATRKGFDVVHSHENSWHGQVQTVHVLPVKYNLLHGLIGWRRLLRWLKIATSPRLLVYLALERSRYSLRHPRAIVLTSSTLVPQMLEAYPACAPALQVVTPGVDRVWGLATAAEKAEARRKLGLPADGFCILFVGNDFRKKGLATLLQALWQLPAHCYGAVVGNPAQVPVFQALAKDAGLGQRVHFLGSLTEVTQAYQAADLLAHPTHEDTYAMVVLEAMAHGLPVVVSCARYCGIAALLTDDADALVLVDPMDAQALTTALTRLIWDQTLVGRLSTAALDFAQQHLWATLALQQEDIYRTVAIRKSAG